MDARKRHLLSQCGLDYLKLLKNPEVKIRFDIVEVLLSNGEVREVRHLPLHELESHPISLKLMVRARGGLDTFPSLVVEELRKAMPQLGTATPA